MVAVARFLPWLTIPPPPATVFRRRSFFSVHLFTPLSALSSACSPNYAVVPFCSHSQVSSDDNTVILPESPRQGSLKPGLYLVGTPIGNLEDITLRALRVLKSADVILAEDTRHSGKLLQYYGIKRPLMSYHKFNESQREEAVLKRLQQGEIVALITDAGMPGISDPGTELVS
ncbi:hypothetical protein Cgig2_003430 [Carnegiea gigantea]|uniref:Tetrapyrrole methylase domain-containing protein n=1 Tax=Carnegiea gigantea TaxID=171969 RepID=A0A9Q1KAC2_9CARY|nr:hypothetical protein Cgig2_003430 [Carnegiea gigantea]